MLPPIRVNEQDRDRWQRLLLLAVERRLGGEWWDSEDGVYGLVDSYTRPGLQHSVEAFRDASGGLWARCSCEAAGPCSHLALTLAQGDPPMMPLYRQVRIEADELATMAVGGVEANERFGAIFGAKS